MKIILIIYLKKFIEKRDFFLKKHLKIYESYINRYVNIDLKKNKKNNCYVMSNDHVIKIDNRIISKIDIRTSIFI